MLITVTFGYMLVQLSSLPVAIAIPTLATQFNVSVEEVALMVVVYLATLGSFVLLAARIGDYIGHNKVFLFGLITLTVASGVICTANDLWQIIGYRAVAGLGSAMIMGNANAMIAATFPPDQRGRAFGVLIIGARFGTFFGLALFGVMLQFIGWRPVFATFIPLGIIAIWLAFNLIRFDALTSHNHELKKTSIGIDWIGAILLASGAIVLILGGNHLHQGDSSFTSSDGLRYHVPMHIVGLILIVTFVFFERMAKNPVINLSHFKNRAFSSSLFTNTTYHFSMLGVFTLIPILVEQGFGKSPLWVTVVLVPSQALGLFVPLIAGSIYDKYKPEWLRPITLVSIAIGFLTIGLVVNHVPFWALPLLMFIISIGTNMFNPINNATVMNSLTVEHRGTASGMLETTRELGHALGATAAAGTLALMMPSKLGFLTREIIQSSYMDGFQIAAFMVAGVLIFGSIVASFHPKSGLEKIAAVED